MITPKDAGPGGRAEIREASPRTHVQARLSDGRIFEARPGTPIEEILRAAFGSPDVPLVAAIVDGRLRELTHPLTDDAAGHPVSLASADGARLYRRSLELLMLVAVDEVFPGAEVRIEHSATTAAGYYCEVRGRDPFTQADLGRIDRRMHEIVAEDAPIQRTTVPVAEALTLFRDLGDLDTARLVSHRDRGSIVLYALHSRRDYFQGYMVPSTGYLKYFALHAFPPGFMLQFPHQHAPTELGPIAPYPKLFAVFEEAGNWLDRLGIRDVGALNDAIVAGRVHEMSLVAEALHEACVARIASEIAATAPRTRVVLIAGPSSSGKTTFSKRLSIQLLVNGLRPMPLALDDYFVDRERTPRDANGDYDYETIHALDLSRFNSNLASLIAGRPTTLPKYNFLTGKSGDGDTVVLPSDAVIVVEGIHGLNPELVSGLPSSTVFRIYVSALTQLNLDCHNRVSTSDCRLVRRIVRDAATRGYNASETLRRWDSVVRGEKRNIFCFQENADAIFNSSLVHELSVLRPLAEPLLLQVRPDTPEYLESNRLLSFLQWFRVMTPDPVPDNSILREFVGGSIFDRLKRWAPPAQPPQEG
jgi:uridine kinase